MPKGLIDLEDDLLAAAKRELNTTGVSGTVRTALQQAAAKPARARQIEWLERGGPRRVALRRGLRDGGNSYWRSSINGYCHAAVSSPVVGNRAQVNIHADDNRTTSANTLAR